VRLTLVEPALVVLIGPSGSGKSTLAARLFRPTEVLSSDGLRAWISDDPADQSASDDAFELLHRLADRRLSRRRTTVIDATNVDPDAREPFLVLAHRHRVPAIAWVLDVPVDVCLTWSRQRPGRQVTASVLRTQRATLERWLPSLKDEGFEEVRRLGPEDLGALELSRAPGARS
jgi:protein phosphatase